MTLVFPDPLGPTRAASWPGLISKSTSRRAQRRSTDAWGTGVSLFAFVAAVFSLPPSCDRGGAAIRCWLRGPPNRTTSARPAAAASSAASSGW